MQGAIEFVDLGKVVAVITIVSFAVGIGRKWGRVEGDGETAKDWKREALKRFEELSKADTEQAVLHARTSERLESVAQLVDKIDGRVTRLEIQ